MKRAVVDVQSLAETDAFGVRLGQRLFPGAVIALVGTLGAGKTYLVRAIAVGLDVPNLAVVTSPTFVLIQEYDARLPIYHFDAYRLQTETQFADLGVHEYFNADGVCLVEWADKVPAVLPSDRLEICITITGASSRHFEVTAFGPRHEALVDAAA
ncbi:MAG: tRNA (adenosine(37)-N6)-threonylcarbamoyltransferase complex ATPase subunit type 1 TsaE [Planctomycetes bacterium]|nr:tRNA (adenosine(37)-N6)-threonylcarbamoyltransferase complex ATPase subunit type 1 TsaE [Planctomycetota bacterium]